MLDPATVGGDLPTPAQMQTLHAAFHAAWRARRMREASRAVVTGNIALGLCVLGVVLVVVHSEWVGTAGPFVACGLLFGYLACLVCSLSCVKGMAKRSLVTVVDRREDAVRKAASEPQKAAAILFAVVAFQASCAVGWTIAFRHMSGTAILVSLAAGPLVGVAFFIRRFVAFRFWEDLLFAGCVALAYAPLFLRTWDLMPLSCLSLVLTILGTASLHTRWVSWTRSFADVGGEDGPVGGLS